MLIETRPARWFSRLSITLLLGMVCGSVSRAQSAAIRLQAGVGGISTQGWSFKVLHAFKDPKDGLGPGGVIRDSAGNLFGIAGGGDLDCSLNDHGCGVVFKLSTAGKLTVLHRFDGSQADQGNPFGSLIQDSSGNLYGTTSGIPLYCGTVFKLDKQGKESVLYTFTCGPDGGIPLAGLIFDSAGNLYGTTSVGGAFGQGVVFKVDLHGAESVLYSFTGGNDGGGPQAGLVRDSAGNVYGATMFGGDPNCDQGLSCGVIFKLDTKGELTVLHTFTGADGAFPAARLVRDISGTLYGTTLNGGVLQCNLTGFAGCGVVFKLNTHGKLTVLYKFKGQADGAVPSTDLAKDAAGNLYGGTGLAGNFNNCAFPGSGCGVVFKLHRNGSESVLHTFTGGPDGGAPGSLLLGADGNLYGATVLAGAGNAGVVFKLTP
jgi:uncharacterized repeat protein (TIGR03803 family)